MNNDESLDEDAASAGASTGASVFEDVDASATSSSVFADEGGLDLSDGELPTDAIESSSSSVFGDAAHAESTEFEPVPIDDGSDDPVDLVASSAVVAGSGSHIAKERFTSGEAIALDVEPRDDDGLDAWSDLGDGAAPAWSEEHETTGETNLGDTWDPGPAPDEESDIVKIGNDDGDGFFGFDDPGAEGGSVVPDQAQRTGSELQSRVVTGIALLVLAVIAINLGPLVALALIVIVVALAAGEFYNALRVAGYQPATLLGLAATIAMPLAVYARGIDAVALILALTVVFGLLWYIVGVAHEMPVMNLGVTLLGVLYIGVLGSFGAALLETTGAAALETADGGAIDGTGLLLIAVILTVSYDVGAFFSGRAIGRTPLTQISPNKTVEGLIGGAALTVVSAVVFLQIIGLVEPFSSMGGFREAIIVGIAAAIMAPLGDLAESLIKRDLGIKDMGSILPGHGGFLDRFDALLFVLPTVYFVALAFFYS